MRGYFFTPSMQPASFIVGSAPPVGACLSSADSMHGQLALDKREKCVIIVRVSVDKK